MYVINNLRGLGVLANLLFISNSGKCSRIMAPWVNSDASHCITDEIGWRWRTGFRLVWLSLSFRKVSIAVRTKFRNCCIVVNFVTTNAHSLSRFISFDTIKKKNTPFPPWPICLFPLIYYTFLKRKCLFRVWLCIDRNGQA